MRRKKLHPETRAGLVWMMEAEMVSADIARDLKVDHSAVSHFLAGRITSAGLRAHFIVKGCPPRLMKGLDRLRKDLQRKRAEERRRKNKKGCAAHQRATATR